MEVREFLASRRARITPELAGLTLFGGRRRVPGLRREEVAMLAGVSVDYYTKLERGNLSGTSESVLDAIARALKLDEAERDHLYNLARASSSCSTPSRLRRTLGRPRCPAPLHRHQGLSPPGRGGTRACLRSDGTRRRPGFTLTVFPAVPGSPSDEAPACSPAGRRPNGSRTWRAQPGRRTSAAP